MHSGRFGFPGVKRGQNFDATGGLLTVAIGRSGSTGGSGRRSGAVSNWPIFEEPSSQGRARALVGEMAKLSFSVKSQREMTRGDPIRRPNPADTAGGVAVLFASVETGTESVEGSSEVHHVGIAGEG